ncbi:hypothetical protein [Phocaeicola sp.]
MKIMKDKPISPQQLKALHASFHALGMDDENRHNHVAHFTDGRTSSTKELTFDEARRLLEQLNGNRSKRQQEEAKTLCRSIYALSMRISWLNKDFGNETREDFEMNKAKINVFCRTRTKFRKNLTLMTLAELKEVKKQLEAIARKEENELNNKTK